MPNDIKTRIWCCNTPVTEPHEEGCNFEPKDPIQKPMFLLWCKLCEWQVPAKDDNALPFGSFEERQDWATAHRSATGHDHWHLFTDIPGVGSGFGTTRGVELFSNGH